MRWPQLDGENAPADCSPVFLVTTLSAQRPSSAPVTSLTSNASGGLFLSLCFTGIKSVSSTMSSSTNLWPGGGGGAWNAAFSGSRPRISVSASGLPNTTEGRGGRCSRRVGLSDLRRCRSSVAGLAGLRRCCFTGRRAGAGAAPRRPAGGRLWEASLGGGRWSNGGRGTPSGGGPKKPGPSSGGTGTPCGTTATFIFSPAAAGDGGRAAAKSGGGIGAPSGLESKSLGVLRSGLEPSGV